MKSIKSILSFVGILLCISIFFSGCKKNVEVGSNTKKSADVITTDNTTSVPEETTTSVTTIKAPELDESWAGRYSNDSELMQLYLWKIEDGVAYFDIYVAGGGLNEMSAKEAETYLVSMPVHGFDVSFTCKDSWSNTLKGQLHFYESEGVKKVDYTSDVIESGNGVWGASTYGKTNTMSYVEPLLESNMKNSILENWG